MAPTGSTSPADTALADDDDDDDLRKRYNVYLKTMIGRYWDGAHQDGELADTFANDFRKWPIKWYKYCTKTACNDFRSALRRRGVWVEDSTRIPVTRALFEAAQRQESYMWKQNEVIHECRHTTRSYMLQSRLTNLSLSRYIKDYYLDTEDGLRKSFVPAPRSLVRNSELVPSIAKEPQILVFAPPGRAPPGQAYKPALKEPASRSSERIGQNTLKSPPVVLMRAIVPLVQVPKVRQEPAPPAKQVRTEPVKQVAKEP
ncbi:hypothetical protein HYFRA_00004730 [Hymenoscyphus fraxineus]|uniref:Uncharacterized protein n=1 Tax=Hymenoscyphus fraxineus TaxID=746836 RepID=A0A9N9KV18_9HELO|nr:hypothetical protein HYFRA_00004730 [Hymenoscyphus fraxineus]